MSNNKFSGNFGEGGRIVFKFKKIAKKKGNCFFHFVARPFKDENKIKKIENPICTINCAISRFIRRILYGNTGVRGSALRQNDNKR